MNDAQRKAYDAHALLLEGALIVNCECCRCGQSTTTAQSPLCRELYNRKSILLSDGAYQCKCGFVIDTNRDDYEEATVGSSMNGLPHITCPRCEQCIGC